MKKTITLLLLLSIAIITVKAQTVSPNDSVLFTQANRLIDKKNKNYNPTEAFKQFTALANKGNAKAMNSLGMLYVNGLGVAMNETEGFSWCEKSAKSGYARAWYNLGSLYKAGIGVNQNFTKAYECFDSGAKLKDKFSIYAKGYFLYEGLGCGQNYTQAFMLFVKGAAMKDLASMYMLGVCFRNGYGTAANPEKAKYWLTRAAEGKYRFAVNELANPTPENIDVLKTENTANNTSIQSKGDIQTNSYQKVTHHVPGNDISGEYTGYQLKFDWSGKHVINQTSLKLTLKQTKNNLTGEWVENGNSAVNVEAMLTDTGLIFNNSSYSRTDHYDQNSPNQLDFKNAQLQLTKNVDTAYLTGNIQLYSSKQKELEKPTFIMLVRNMTNDLPDNNLVISKTDSLHFIAYPNPFINSLSIKYTLIKSCNVRILVSRLQDASIIYKSESQYLNAGDHSNVLSLNTAPGACVITLIYGNQIKSAIVFKN